jgi:hypothetical protein
MKLTAKLCALPLESTRVSGLGLALGWLGFPDFGLGFAEYMHYI